MSADLTRTKITTTLDRPAGTQVAEAENEGKRTSLYGAIWRLHFYAGLLIAPILIWASITGTLYVFNPQIEDALYRQLYFVTPAGTPLSFDEQLAAVKQQHPDATIKQFVAKATPERTTQVVITPASHAGHGGGHDHGPPPDISVYVNPYTGAIVGTLAEASRFKILLKNLHGNFMAGDNGRPIMELGASWLLILLISGVVLWFPRKKPGVWGVWLPRIKAGGRVFWRDLHTMGGLYLLPVVFVIVATGLTWSRFSGDIYKVTRDSLGQNIALFGRFTSSPANGRTPLTLNQVDDLVKAQGVTLPYTLTPPRDDKGTYRVLTADPIRFTEWRFMIIDQYSGALVKNVTWNDAPFLMKLSIVGIPFHRGEFGLWNQLINTLACVVIIGSVVSGVMMWWKRRPAGKLGAPKRVAIRSVPRWWIAMLIVFLLVLPTAGISLVLILLVDRFVVQPLLRRQSTTLAGT
jgi:uncharacterized iron-regulated membrane protein